MSYILEKEALFAETEEVLNAVASPEFLDTMIAFKAKKGSERSVFAMQYMTPDELVKKGVPLPDKMRVSSRMFEEDNGEADFLDVAAAQTIVANLKNNRPDLWSVLEADHGDLATALTQVQYMDIAPWDTPLGVPIETIMDAEAGALGIDIDPYAAWACGCGGAATACAGAGGGT